MIARPSHKELTGKLAEAKAAVAGGRTLFARPDKVVGELSELKTSAQDVWTLIRELLEEVEPQHYVGTRPPQKSYEAVIAGKELFAFAWFSKKLRRPMYLKFALVEGRYYYLSLHRDKKE